MKKLLILLFLLFSINCNADEKDVISNFNTHIFVTEFGTIPGYEVVKRTKWIIDEYSLSSSSLESSEKDHRKTKSLFSLEMYQSSRIVVRTPDFNCIQMAVRTVSNHCQQCNAIINLRCTIGYKRIVPGTRHLSDKEFQRKVVLLYGEPVVVRKITQ